MGVFDDKKFEKLDWMTQITETIDSELNELLAMMPDRWEFTIDDIKHHASTYNSFGINLRSAVNNLVQKTKRDLLIRYDDLNTISHCFEFETSPDLEIDFEHNTVQGYLALVKVVPTLSDEQLLLTMGHEGIEKINNIQFEDKWPLDRMNEMLDVLGKCEEAQRNRSYSKKLKRIKERLHEIFKTNEWRIRDMRLANRVGFWIADYIATGNLASLTNFCKLKVMTHHNMPIYSVEEEK